MNQLYWIGLTDKFVEGEFFWTSTGENAEYTNWAIGEPDGFQFEDCVHLGNASDGRTWNDISCWDSDLFALCERGW